MLKPVSLPYFTPEKRSWIAAPQSSSFTDRKPCFLAVSVTTSTARFRSPFLSLPPLLFLQSLYPRRPHTHQGVAPRSRPQASQTEGHTSPGCLLPNQQYNTFLLPLFSLPRLYSSSQAMSRSLAASPLHPSGSRVSAAQEAAGNRKCIQDASGLLLT